MDVQSAKALLEKYRNGTCNPREKAVVEEWYNSRGSRELRTAIEEDLAVEQDLIWGRITTRIDSGNVSKTNLHITFLRIAGIAAAVATIVFGIWFFNSSKQSGILADTAKIDKFIKPGVEGASLTLANGRRIKLSGASNGLLAKEGGVLITKSASGELIYEIQDAAADVNAINTLSTAKGETYNVRLPDGSLVWLNAASSLSYAVKLIKGGNRIVKLQGEAYFEISKDKAHPFYVETENQTVKVLGTHFNINSYADEAAVITTLTEGAIEINSSSGTSLMSPGEQAVNQNGNIRISAAGLPDALAWKDGYFDFNDEDIKSVMKQLARWYNLEISYLGKPEAQGYTGKLSRSNKISEVLKALESTYTVQFKIQERRIEVITK